MPLENGFTLQQFFFAVDQLVSRISRAHPAPIAFRFTYFCHTFPATIREIRPHGSIEAFCLRMLHKKSFNVSNRWYAPDLHVSKMSKMAIVATNFSVMDLNGFLESCRKSQPSPFQKIKAYTTRLLFLFWNC